MKSSALLVLLAAIAAAGCKERGAPPLPDLWVGIDGSAATCAWVDTCNPRQNACIRRRVIPGTCIANGRGYTCLNGWYGNSLGQTGSKVTCAPAGQAPDAENPQ